MDLLRKFVSAALVCLLSFIGRFLDLGKRAICVVCAVAVIFSVLPLAVSAAGDTSSELLETSFELTPNDADPDVTITLNGMMPKNAAAEATDVTDNMENPDEDSAVISAYDISINSGAGEFQPAEGHPIYVEISNPAIYDSGNISLIHIADDGTIENVEHFTVEDGKVSFYATGFSIYEIVDFYSAYTSCPLAKNVGELTQPDGVNYGFLLFYGDPANYFTSAVNSNGALIETTDPEQAAVWFFEEATEVEGTLKLYTYVNGVKKYLHTKSGNNIELSTTAADLLDLSMATTSVQSPTFNIKKNGVSLWLQHSGSGNGIRYYKDKNNVTNSRIFIRHAPQEEVVIDQLAKLTEKPYGLFHYSEGSTVGNALMAAGDTHSLVKLVLTAEGNHRILYHLDPGGLCLECLDSLVI